MLKATKLKLVIPVGCGMLIAAGLSRMTRVIAEFHPE
jgi:hypothetical protein